MQRDAALEAVFMPVRPPSTFEETVERLGTAIRLGLLPPGSRLPSERDLASELRISRSTLRHALTTLVQSGHLVSLRGRAGGTFVSEQPPLAEGASPTLGAQTWAVLEYRVAIEAGATLLAAERVEPADLERACGRIPLAVLLRIEKRVRDHHGNLVTHLGRDDGVREDQDVRHSGGILSTSA